MTRPILAALALGLLPACGSDSSDGGDADSDVDADTDGDSDGAEGDCLTNCASEALRCGEETEPDCVAACQAAGDIDTQAWTDCLNAISPPCGDMDPDCCIVALGCRGF